MDFSDILCALRKVSCDDLYQSVTLFNIFRIHVATYLVFPRGDAGV